MEYYTYTFEANETQNIEQEKNNCELENEFIAQIHDPYKNDDSVMIMNNQEDVNEHFYGHIQQDNQIGIVAKRAIKFWLLNHWTYPYPSNNEIREFSRHFNLSRDQVRSVFSLYRSKMFSRKPLMRKKNIYRINIL